MGRFLPKGWDTQSNYQTAKYYFYAAGTSPVQRVLPLFPVNGNVQFGSFGHFSVWLYSPTMQAHSLAKGLSQYTVSTLVVVFNLWWQL